MSSAIQWHRKKVGSATTSPQYTGVSVYMPLPSLEARLKHFLFIMEKLGRISGRLLFSLVFNGDTVSFLPFCLYLVFITGCSSQKDLKMYGAGIEECACICFCLITKYPFSLPLTCSYKCNLYLEAFFDSEKQNHIPLKFYQTIILFYNYSFIYYFLPPD